MALNFTYNEVTHEWECDYEGTVYAEDTFIELATVINAIIWEN